MSKQHKNNSIIFLTTLSVYLGLVLVGGAHSASAQAILQNKVEVEHLTDEKILAEYVSLFQSLYVLSKDFSVHYSEEIKNISDNKLKDGEYQLNCFYIINPDFSQTIIGIDGWIIDSPKFRPSLEKLYKIFPHITEKDKSQIKFNLSLTDKDFSLKVTAFQGSDEQAAQIFDAYINKLSRLKIQQVGWSQIIYQNTEISKENNQILIITCLPRGSLDEFLKQNAKAEDQ